RAEKTVGCRTPDICDIGLTRSCSRLDERLQNRFQIEGRAADDLEHVGGGGLLLQRFAQLVEQASILDGDDGLTAEILHQADLSIREGADLMAGDGGETEHPRFL